MTLLFPLWLPTFPLILGLVSLAMTFYADATRGDRWR